MHPPSIETINKLSPLIALLAVVINVALTEWFRSRFSKSEAKRRRVEIWYNKKLQAAEREFDQIAPLVTVIQKLKYKILLALDTIQNHPQRKIEWDFGLELAEVQEVALRFNATYNVIRTLYLRPNDYLFHDFNGLQTNFSTTLEQLGPIVDKTNDTARSPEVSNELNKLLISLHNKLHEMEGRFNQHLLDIRAQVEEE